MEDKKDEVTVLNTDIEQAQKGDNKQNNKEQKQQENDDKKKTLKTVIITIICTLLFIIILLLLVLFSLKKCTKDNSISSEQSISEISIEESQYKNFYDQLVSVSNEYIYQSFNIENYVGFINAITYENRVLTYTCITSSKDEAALFSYGLEKASLEEVIEHYNDNPLDLSLLEVTLERYEKETNPVTVNKYSFYGLSMGNPNKKCYSGTYKDNNEYVSVIDLLDGESNIVKSIKTNGDISFPLTYSLLKYIYNLTF